jgi:hypothetical protein
MKDRWEEVYRSRRRMASGVGFAFFGAAITAGSWGYFAVGCILLVIFALMEEFQDAFRGSLRYRLYLLFMFCSFIALGFIGRFWPEQKNFWSGFWLFTCVIAIIVMALGDRVTEPEDHTNGA